MIRAVAFDLDDTLYPEVEFVYGGYRAVSAAVQRRWGIAIFDELTALFEKGERGDLFTPILKRRLGEIAEADVVKLVGVYRRHLPRLSPFPEARQVLDQLKQRSFLLGLISDGHWAVQERKLKALQLGPCFQTVVFPDAWGREFWKPHPRPYKACARQLGVAPAAMAYVGDNPAKDFVGARALGMPTIRVRRKGTLHAAERLAPEVEADIEVSTLDGVPEAVAFLRQAEHTGQ